MTQFPIYRKYNGLEVWFKIIDLTHFIQYKKMGSKLLVDEIEAKIFPGKLFIQDMISFREGRWVEVTESELKEFIA